MLTIKTGMVLAAGLGLRMRPLTETTPKPLVPVAGRTLLDRALDRYADAGVETAVVNVHHLADQVEAHLTGRSDLAIRISDERVALLETGGGIRHALPLLGDQPFFVANSDAIVLNANTPALGRLTARWNDDEMDGLLLLHSTVEAYGYSGLGDFDADPLGRLERRAENRVAPFLFTGVQILHPRLFDGAPDGAFSLNVLYDKALAAGRLFGVVHDGEWFHVGDADGLAEAEAYMAVRYPGTRHRGDDIA
jgi:MurNAc alpha-1-phosphate uridylyltransferase